MPSICPARVRSVAARGSCSPSIQRQLDDLVLAAGLGQAEVEDLDDRPVAVAREHQVARLDVAVNHALLVGVLQAQGRLLNEVAGVADGHRSAGLDHPGQVQAVDVLHGEDQALAAAKRGVGGDDVGVAKLSDGADLAEKAIHHARALDDVPAHDLEDLVASHQAVVGQVDHAHAASAQLAEDLVVGVVGKLRGISSPRGRCRWSWWTRVAAAVGELMLRVERPRRKASRKPSEERPATLSKQSWHSSRCVLTASAEAASSWPLPNACSICSEGCREGGACMRRSPEPRPDPEVRERITSKKRQSRGETCRENEKLLQEPAGFFAQPPEDTGLGLDHGVDGHAQLCGHLGGRTSFHGELLERVPGRLVEIRFDGRPQGVADVLVMFLVELPGEQAVRVGDLIEEAVGLIRGHRGLPVALPPVDPDAIDGDLPEPGAERAQALPLESGISWTRTSMTSWVTSSTSLPSPGI